MKYAYILENQGKEDLRDNSPVFQLIQEMDIEDDCIIVDEDLEREELAALLPTLTSEDTLIVRSIVDLAEDYDHLVSVLQSLSSQKVMLFSSKEPSLCGEDCFSPFRDSLLVLKSITSKKQKTGYEQALEEGRVGRPAKTAEIQKAVELYGTGKYSIGQIEALTGVSKSTIYRNIKIE